MDPKREYPDLLKALEVAQGSVRSLRSVWCEPSTTFTTNLSQRVGIIIDGAWSPQFLVESELPWTVPFTKRLHRPRILWEPALAGTVVDWLPLLENVAKLSNSLLIVTGKIDEDLLTTLITNAIKETLHVCVARLGVGYGIDGQNPFSDKQLNGIPQQIIDLPTTSEAWIRRGASVIFSDMHQGNQSIAEEIMIIKVGGEDYCDQRERLRFLSNLIRQIERGESNQGGGADG